MHAWQRNAGRYYELAIVVLWLVAALLLLAFERRLLWAAIGVVPGAGALLWAAAARARARASEARSQALLGSALDAIVIIDQHGRVVEWNAAAERTFEIARADALGRPMADLIVPEALRGAHREGMARVLRTGEARILGRRMELPACRADGSQFPSELTVARVATRGAPLFVGFVRDLTAARRAEEALRVSEERLRLLAESASDVVYRYRFRPTRGFEYVSPAATTVVGWTPEQHYADPDFAEKIIHPADRSRLETLLERGTGGQPVDLRWIHPDGTVVSVEHRDTAVYGEHGEVVAVHGIARDVTERRRDEREQRFLAEVGGALASTLDVDEAAARAAGAVVGFLADCCVIDLCPRGPAARVVKAAHADPSAAPLARALERAARAGGPLPLVADVLRDEQPVLRSDLSACALADAHDVPESKELVRRLGPTSAIALPLEARGRILGVMLVLSTDSARRYDTRDLRLGEELARRVSLAIESAQLYGAAQHAIRARDDVLGLVAHDLRNPLSAAQMAAGFITRHLSRDLQDAAGKPVRLAAERIVRSIDRASALIADLLDVSQIEAGSLRVVRGPVPAAELVADAVDTFAPQAAQASLRLETEVAGDAPAVLADTDRVQQVFSNLVGNAIKFTPAGGGVRVGAARVGGEVRFRVEDTGPGISDGELPHVFDRFWQGRRGDRRGAGLGLPIAKGIVEAHGGRVWAESHIGRGSTFYFTLPVAPAAETLRRRSA